MSQITNAVNKMKEKRKERKKLSGKHETRLKNIPQVFDRVRLNNSVLTTDVVSVLCTSLHILYFTVQKHGTGKTKPRAQSSEISTKRLYMLKQTSAQMITTHFIKRVKKQKCFSWVALNERNYRNSFLSVSFKLYDITLTLQRPSTLSSSSACRTGDSSEPSHPQASYGLWSEHWITKLMY